MQKQFRHCSDARSVASDLGLQCLTICHFRDTRHKLIRVNKFTFKGSDSVIFIFASFPQGNQHLKKRRYSPESKIYVRVEFILKKALSQIVYPFGHKWRRKHGDEPIYSKAQSCNTVKPVLRGHPKEGQKLAA